MIEIKRESLLIFVAAALVVGFVIGRAATKRELASLPAIATHIATEEVNQQLGIAGSGSTGPSAASSATPRASAPASQPASPPAAAARPAPPVGQAPAPRPAATTTEAGKRASASSRPAPPTTSSPSSVTPIKRLQKVWKVRTHEDDASIGPADAPVTVVLFSAFGCQPCMQFAPELEKFLEDPAYKGNVRVLFKHKIFDAPSPDAFVAARAAAAAQLQGKFWPMRKALHEARFNVGRDNVRAIAAQVGLNMARFDRDLDSDAVRAKVLRDSLVAYEVGAHSFPNILANGVRIGKPKDFKSLKKLVDGQLARAADFTKEGLKGAALYAKAISSGKSFPQLDPKKVVFKNVGAAIMGAKNGRIELATFEDFECPFCAKAAPNLKEFVDRYPKDVKLIFKHFPLDSHPNAPLAHEASLEALAQGKFWPYHDKLFANQKALQPADLERYAKEVGMNVATFKKALSEGTHKPALQRDVVDGRRGSVSGTPTVFLNGQKYQGPRGFNPLGLEAVAREYLGMKPRR